MNEVHFVLEKPQKHGQSAKKRSRLVTSCDACRARKVKCTPSEVGDATCKACFLSGSDCVYSERDRIRAERGIVDLTASRARAKPRSLAPSNSHMSSKSSSKSEKRSPRSSASKLYVPASVSFPLPFSNLDDGLSVPWTVPFTLFDMFRPHYPNSMLLHHFINIFGDYGKSLFPFIDADELISQATAESLSPLIANCVAAFSARYSSQIHHTPGARHLSGEVYLQTAKSILDPLINLKVPSVEILHALIIIAWVEYGSGRPSGLWTFGRTATLMLSNLNLDSEDHIAAVKGEMMRNRLRCTYWAVAWLDILSSSVARVPSHLRLLHSSAATPYMELESAGTFPRKAMFNQLQKLLAMMGMLSQVSNKAPMQSSSSSRDVETAQFRNLMASTQKNVPEDLMATPQSLRMAYASGIASEFVLLHMLINTMVIVAYCPSLFWKTAVAGNRIEYGLAVIGWSAARAIVDVLLMLQDVDERRIISTPSYFMSLSIASGALLLKTKDTTPSPTSQELYDYAEDMNLQYLAEARRLMTRVGMVWTNTVEEIGFQAITIAKAQAQASVVHPRSASYDLQATSAFLQLQPRYSPENIVVTGPNETPSVFHYQHELVPSEQPMYPSDSAAHNVPEPNYFEGTTFVKEYDYISVQQRSALHGATWSESPPSGQVTQILEHTEEITQRTNVMPPSVPWPTNEGYAGR